jgi:outer membrane protein insertion porin family
MGGPLGFDTDLYDLEANGSLYIPLWFRHVLSLRGRVEVLDVYGGTEEVPISERLFLGGARTVRGFRYRWVGPKAVSAATGEVRPSGGQTLALASAEYTVPVVSGVRVAAFYDIGSLGYGPYEFEADALASGAGLGVRLDIPGFPMRFDYAWPIDKDDDATKVEHFTFSVTYGY